MCSRLVGRTSDVIPLESDILWRRGFDSPDDDYHEYRNLWLRLCKNISQAGRPVLLCGSVSPGQYESCVEYRYFARIHYLALTCEDQVLAARLRTRPSWRNSSGEDFIEKHLRWNKWLKENAHKQDLALLDTGDVSIEDTIERVETWIHDRLRNTQQRVQRYGPKPAP